MLSSKVKLPVLVTFIFFSSLFATPIQASGTLDYGTHLGMEVDVVSVKGLGSIHAKIVTIHTRQNAKKYCIENQGNESADCVNKELAIPMNDFVTANCKTGEFTDFFGAKYRMEGKIKKVSDLMQAKFALRYLNGRERGQLADGSNPSEYPVAMDIFQHLCPSALNGEDP